ncbi:MAG: hypothetical protein WAU47_13490, partial [Desulfobaccales bacterium]
MSLQTRRTLMIFLGLMVVTGWAGNAAAHRRNSLIAARLSQPAVTQPSPQTGETADSQQLTSESYWRRLLAQEQAREFQEVWKTGLTLVNLFPQAPQRGAVLLKLGELAKTQGKTAQALELYSLVSFLNPGAPEAAQAHVAASALELSRDLKKKNPLQTMHLFLDKISHLNPGHQAEVVQEALVAGWQEVSRQARTTSPLSLSLVEELLALWNKQPPKMRPPEGAFLLADLLKKAGLWEEAQV